MQTNLAGQPSENMDNGLIEDLRSKYTSKEVQEIIKLLFHFSKTGQICAVRIFMAAALLKKKRSFSELMNLFGEHLEVWKTNPSRIGDPDDIDNGWGMRNAEAYFSIYHTLGLNPKAL